MDKIELNLRKLTESERKRLMELIEKANKPGNKGEELIGREIKAGTRFKVINVEPHRWANTRTDYVCLDEYIGQTAFFNSNIGFTFRKDNFACHGTYDKDYMNAIDKENGKICWRYDEVEILD